MKNIFAVLGILAVIVLALNDSEPRDEYTRDDIEGAWHEGYEKGYEEGYAEAEHYLQPDIWEAEDLAYERGCEDGYEHGYDDGYYDCLEEYGLLPEPEVTGERARLEKD